MTFQSSAFSSHMPFEARGNGTMMTTPERAMLTMTALVALGQDLLIPILAHGWLGPISPARFLLGSLLAHGAAIVFVRAIKVIGGNAVRRSVAIGCMTALAISGGIGYLTAGAISACI